MTKFREKLRQSGYDAEEAYFYKLEQELIQKTREKTRRERSHLTLLQGGKTDSPPQALSQATKKAA